VLLDLLIVYFIDRAFDRPIQFFGKLGLGFLVLSVAIFGWALVLKYAWNLSLIQTPLPLLAATIGLSGVLFLLLGIIAEVQSRIYFEARGRPPYKIRRVVQNPAQPLRRASPGPWEPAAPRLGGCIYLYNMLFKQTLMCYFNDVHSTRERAKCLPKVSLQPPSGP